MGTDPTNIEVLALRLATGMPLLACRELLRLAPPTMRAKLLLAAGTQDGSRHLSDPMKGDPSLAAAFEGAAQESVRLVATNMTAFYASLSASPETVRRGTCRLYRHYLKRLLKERHGIDWPAPAETHPEDRLN